jgi:cell division protein FtsI (penicillin-binding protein 3)/stage V sporulation protein D (sporulation-specific penicillin-binding protein)
MSDTQSNRWKNEKKHSVPRDVRAQILSGILIMFAGVIVVKLFFLQVIDHGFYSDLASGQHDLFQELFPERGDILIHDDKDNNLIAAVTNQKLAFVFADPRQIKDVAKTVDELSKIFSWDEETKTSFTAKFAVNTDPYEPIKRHVSDDDLVLIEALKLPGIDYIRESSRLYPEAGLGGHLFGFLGSNSDGTLSGKYGVEGFFDDALTGTPGFLRSEGDIAGRLIASADRAFQPAIDGADVVLTIDRNIQYFVCDQLKKTVLEYNADGGSVVVVEPKTGRVLAMCGLPDFDPNNYGQVANIDQFNNPAIFNAYEPGSVFKPLTMSAALDVGAVEPTTTYEDTGTIMVDGWDKPISNADNKTFGVVTMTQVLENSVNTGTIFAMRETGQDQFVDYVKKFGFGEPTGIEIDTESVGDISSLKNKAEVYAATASFGQGITVTPIQLVMAFAALANGGVLLEPQIIDEIKYSDGVVDKREKKEVRRVVSERAASLIGAMLVSVVEIGHGKKAGVPGYYIAGKTGTAQVASGGSYESNKNIGTFAGFGPVSSPRFAMTVRIDNPHDVGWAESTAAPLFGAIADFILKYYEVPPER